MLLRAATFLVAFLAAVISGSNAATVEFTEIANNQGPFSAVAIPSINNQGQVSFVAMQGDAQRVVLFNSDGEFLEATQTDVRPSFATTDLTDSGEVIFFGSTPEVQGGLFRSGPGSFETLTPLATFDDGRFDFFGARSVSGNGMVAGFVEEAGRPESVAIGLFDQTGAFTVLQRRSDIDISNTGIPRVNDNGDIVYLSFGGTDQITFLQDGSSEVIAESGTTFSALGTPDINNNGDVVFTALTDSGRGAFQYTDGMIEEIFQDLDISNGIGSPQINDLGDVIAFVVGPGDAFNGSVFFSEGGGASQPIISIGDTLAGRIVSSIFIGRQALNNSGQFAFLVGFEDGSSANFVADLRGSIISEVPLPGAMGLFLIGVASLRVKRRKRHL